MGLPCQAVHIPTTRVCTENCTSFTETGKYQRNGRKTQILLGDFETHLVKAVDTSKKKSSISNDIHIILHNQLLKCMYKLKNWQSGQEIHFKKIEITDLCLYLIQNVIQSGSPMEKKQENWAV